MKKKKILIPLIFTCAAAGVIFYALKKKKDVKDAQANNKAAPIIKEEPQDITPPEPDGGISDVSEEKSLEEPVPEEEDIEDTIDDIPLEEEKEGKYSEDAAEGTEDESVLEEPFVEDDAEEEIPEDRERPEEPVAGSVPYAEKEEDDDEELPQKEDNDTQTADEEIEKETVSKENDTTVIPPTFRDAVERYIETEDEDENSVMSDAEIDEEVVSFFETSAGASVVSTEKIDAIMNNGPLPEETPSDKDDIPQNTPQQTPKDNAPIQKETTEKIKQIFEEDNGKKSRRERRREKKNKMPPTEEAKEDEEQKDATQNLSKLLGVELKKIEA